MEFAHKGGVHGAAVAKVERSYQHVDPTLIGNRGRLVVSELGGKANTQLRAEQLGHQLDGVEPRELSKLIEQLEGRELLAEATVKVVVAGEVLHTAADGNGPVNALDAALRKALGAFYPVLDGVHLRDYKVRILDGNEATAARTRVVIDSTEGARTWSTMGSDTNIIAASAAALADSLEYAIWTSGGELRRRDERRR